MRLLPRPNERSETNEPEEIVREEMAPVVPLEAPLTKATFSFKFMFSAMHTPRPMGKMIAHGH